MQQLLVVILVVPFVLALLRVLWLTIYIEVLRVARFALYIFGIFLRLCIFAHRQYWFWQHRHELRAKN